MRICLTFHLFVGGFFVGDFFFITKSKHTQKNFSYVCSTLKREKIPNLTSWYPDSSNRRKSQSWCHESHLKWQKKILQSHIRYQQKNAMEQVSLGKYQFLCYRSSKTLSNALALNLARTQLDDWCLCFYSPYCIETANSYFSLAQCLLLLQ